MGHVGGKASQSPIRAQNAMMSPVAPQVAQVQAGKVSPLASFKRRSQLVMDDDADIDTSALQTNRRKNINQFESPDNQYFKQGAAGAND